MVYVAFVIFAVYVLTRFGRAITASRALPVWLVLGALGAIIVDPDLLFPVAKLFGIQLVSNLVFATMLLFLLFESLKGAAEQTTATRKMRKLVSRLASRDVEALGSGRTLVVVPAYNEAESIGDVAQQLSDLVRAHPHIKAVIVDDGSSDGTAQLARSKTSHGVHVVSHSINCGVGGVLMTGFMIAVAYGFESVVQCDGDGQHPVLAIPELAHEGSQLGADLLIGSRFADGSEDGGTSTTGLRRVGGTLISWALATFGKQAVVSDPTSGFRCYSLRAARLLIDLMPDDYPEPESVALCAVRGLRVCERPVLMQARHRGSSSISGWTSAIFMIKVLTALLSYRLRFALGRS